MSIKNTVNKKCCLVGQKMKIVNIDALKPIRQRFLQMGMTPGTVFQVKRQAPLGDPMEIDVRGTRVVLRRSEIELLDLQVVP